MAMTTDEVNDFRESANLLGADELRAMLGSGDEEDAIINDVLAGGKAVEMKTKPDGTGDDDDDAHPNPDDKRVDPKAKPVAGDDDDDDDDDDEEDAGAAAAPPAGAPAAPAPGAADDTAAPAALGEVAPLDLAFLDGEFKAKLGALDLANQKDFKAMMDGELDPEEYAARNTKYLDARDSMRDEKAAHAAYFTQVHDFKTKALTDGINYDADPAKAEAWDAWVKHVAASPAGQNMSDADILATAHKKVMIEFDIKPGAGAPAGDDKSAQNSGKNVPDGKKVADKQARAPKLDNIPPTLGGIPAAATSDGQDGGEFAHLENLSGIAFERAIAAMSPDQRDRYGMN